LKNDKIFHNIYSIRNGWLEVESGGGNGGNGRVYWTYNEVSQFSQLATTGFNPVMTGSFMLKPGFDNLSNRNSKHGMDGWVFDGQYVLGRMWHSISYNRI
jgi:hypothetical protein